MSYHRLFPTGEQNKAKMRRNLFLAAAVVVLLCTGEFYMR
jgi:hypothetical protein